jgi:hypothetical protein
MYNNINSLQRKGDVILVVEVAAHNFNSTDMLSEISGADIGQVKTLTL